MLRHSWNQIAHATPASLRLAALEPACGSLSPGSLEQGPMLEPTKGDNGRHGISWLSSEKNLKCWKEANYAGQDKGLLSAPLLPLLCFFLFLTWALSEANFFLNLCWFLITPAQIKTLQTSVSVCVCIHCEAILWKKKKSVQEFATQAEASFAKFYLGSNPIAVW